jgi:hypothetical protein
VWIRTEAVVYVEEKIKMMRLVHITLYSLLAIAFRLYKETVRRKKETLLRIKACI